MKNILSLFDGMSGAQVALNKVGIKYNNYYASEIDKYARAVTQFRFPDTIQLGDISKINVSDLPKIDLIIAGFPCTDLSIAKKDRKGLQGERSGLFYEAVRLLKDVKPKWFLFENVASMSKKDKAIITDILGVEPILINSALLSAQNRKRLYWTNIHNIEQPSNRKIMLKNILEPFTDVDDRMVVKGKSFALTASYKGYGNDGVTIIAQKPIRIGAVDKGFQSDRIYSDEGNSVSLSANGGGMGARTGLYAIAQRGRYLNEHGNKVDIKGADTKQRMETSFSEKSNAITSAQKDSMLLDVNDDEYVIRKLTPIECERLQTVPDNYTLVPHPVYKNKMMSNTQRYKMLGNGFTIDVIAHILSFISCETYE